jgi:hypothetical protein
MGDNCSKFFARSAVRKFSNVTACAAMQIVLALVGRVYYERVGIGQHGKVCAIFFKLIERKCCGDNAVRSLANLAAAVVYDV